MIATLALVLALALSPAGIAASHGPGNYAASLSVDAGHVHPWDQAGAAHHDATDHEHQTAAILPGSGNTICDACTVALQSAARLSGGHDQDRPRRPLREDVI